MIDPVEVLSFVERICDDEMDHRPIMEMAAVIYNKGTEQEKEDAVRALFPMALEIDRRNGAKSADTKKAAKEPKAEGQKRGGKTRQRC